MYLCCPLLLPCHHLPPPGTPLPSQRIPPSSRVHGYSLASMELSERSLEELRAVRAAKPGLVITHPALDSHPEPLKGFSMAF